MPATTKHPGEPDLTEIVIPTEQARNLRSLIAAARADLKPRNFAERHLVDQMAICQWRQHRVMCMERSVYEHEYLDFDPKFDKYPDGKLVEPMDDFYFLAQLHSPDRHAAVLAALSRLEARYHRQFCSSLRLLNSLRRNPDFNTSKEQSQCEH